MKRKRGKMLLAGVHKVPMRLASGKQVTYHYAWRGGPRIKADPDTHAYVEEWCRLTRDRTDMRASETVADLIREYVASEDYTNLSEASKASYSAMIDLIEAEYCDMPLALVSAKGARHDFITWRGKYAATPRKADLLKTVFAKILAFGEDRELIDRNPLRRVKNLSNANRKDVIWSDLEIAAFRAKASQPMDLAMMLALETGQRQGDILKLPWSAYDGTHFKLRQGKRGAFVRVRLTEELRRMVDDARKRADAAQKAGKPPATTILITDRMSRPYTNSGFRASWRRVCEKAGIGDRHFHDLRGTFVTWAYRAGASIKEIAEISGHSEKDAETIIRKHYLAGDSAIVRLENRNKKAKES